jgi:uncharacterized membrane protein
MDEWVFLLGVLLTVLFIGGPICGIIALVKNRKLRLRLQALENEVKSLRSPAPREEERPAAPMEEEIEVEPTPAAVETAAPPADPLFPPLDSESEDWETLIPPPEEKRPSLEMKLGTKWLNWVGIVMVVLGIAFFLKYAYDNAWIGPKGRLALGVLFGVVALGIGERFRRKDWQILFQVLTGGGLAAFYLCVYFSFQVYHLSEQTISMVLAILVTGLAVVMAVAHDAAPVAILALVGGFLSPVLLSTGTNHPYALFTYIAILDLVAMGAAYFRRWRALDLLCFIGTALIYQGWHDKFYAHDQMTPALIYTTLFYLMFLLIPTLYSLVRRLPETMEGLGMIVANAVFSFFCYYQVLFRDYRYVLGFVVLGQAVLVLGLFQLWANRLGKENHTAASLLIISLGLVTIAIPIQLKFYGIPVAWGMEGAVLVCIGIRFRQVICKVSGVFALILAAGGLTHRLPLHKAIFTPVFNVPFGSWALVIAMASIAAYLLYKDKEGGESWQPVLTTISFLLAFALTCGLLTQEVSQFWTINHRIMDYRTYEFSSLCVLWSLIPAVTTYILQKKEPRRWEYLSWVCFAIGALVFMGGLRHYRFPSHWLMLNSTFAPKLLFILALWWGARLFRENKLPVAADVIEIAGHGFLALLVAFEFERWGRYGDLITVKMGRSLISAGWALQAFMVIWIGLAARNRLLRYAGFGLFGFAIAKTLLVDMSEVEKVYRIVSFLASGLLLVGAGYFYQRYSAVLLRGEDGEEPE